MTIMNTTLTCCNSDKQAPKNYKSLISPASDLLFILSTDNYSTRFIFSVLQQRWFGDRKSIQPVKNWLVVWWFRWYNWHFMQRILVLTTITFITSWCGKIQDSGSGLLRLVMETGH